MGIHISQSEYNATVTPESVRKQRSKAANTAYTHRPCVFTPKSGNVKSTKLSTESAHSRSSPPAYALGLTGSYDKLECRQPSLIQSKAVKERTSIASTSTRTTASMSSPAGSSFQSSTNSSFQNYTHRLPAVRMARTKQTARRVRDDRQRGRERQQEGDRRHDRSNTPPKRIRRRSPSPQRFKCVFCGLISFQRRNHRRHLVIQHNCRPDGTPATAADIEQAKRWDSIQLTGRSARYKLREFVDSDSDDDTTPIGSGTSTPSERCPSPSRSSRQKRMRSESSGSSSPQRDTRRVVSRQPATPSPTASRPATPPQSASPVRKQVRRVRFERGKTTATSEEVGTATQKKPAKQPTEKAKKPTTATRKDKKAKVEESPTTETETQQTPTVATSARELLVSTPKLDALTEVAKQAVWNLKKSEVGKQAVWNLKKSEVGVKFKEPLAKPERGKQPPPKRHHHPLPTKGKSAYVGKRKATAPSKKLPEVITISARDVLESLLPAPELKVTSSSRPSATSVLKPIATIAETITTNEMQIEDAQNKDNEARELPPTTDVRPDLELSQDTEEEEIHGVHIVDLDAEKPFIEFSTRQRN